LLGEWGGDDGLLEVTSFENISFCGQLQVQRKRNDSHLLFDAFEAAPSKLLQSLAAFFSQI